MPKTRQARDLLKEWERERDKRMSYNDSEEQYDDEALLLMQAALELRLLVLTFISGMILGGFLVYLVMR